MALGVDTASRLDSIDKAGWQAFESYEGRYPSYAGRYFSGPYAWVLGEGKSAKIGTGGVLSKIFPI